MWVERIIGVILDSVLWVDKLSILPMAPVIRVLIELDVSNLVWKSRKFRRNCTVNEVGRGFVFSVWYWNTFPQVARVRLGLRIWVNVPSSTAASLFSGTYVAVRAPCLAAVSFFLLPPPFGLMGMGRNVDI